MKYAVMEVSVELIRERLGLPDTVRIVAMEQLPSEAIDGRGRLFLEGEGLPQICERHALSTPIVHVSPWMEDRDGTWQFKEWYAFGGPVE